MSRIFNSDEPDNCRPWKAPNFEAVEDSNIDYRLPNDLGLTNHQKQQTVRQQAFEKSFAKGYMEGLAQGQKEMRAQVEHLQSIMATLAMPLPGIDEQVVNELVTLCMAVVKQMVRRELKISPGEVVAVVKEAVSLLPVTAGNVRLELHPKDAALVRKAYGDDADASNNSNWQIVEDPLLTRGGCKVITNTSRIDATVENRIHAAIAAVMGGERMVDSSHE